MARHPQEQLTAYADGELAPEARAEVERHLAACTECTRELAITHNLKGAIRMMQINDSPNLWGGIHRRLTKPVGWMLILAGVAVWAVLAAIQWFRSELTLEWLAATAIITGLILLITGIAHEQYRSWKNERYKDVER